MATIDIKPATMADAAEMAPAMRLADATEVKAAGGYSPKEALEISIAISTWAWTVRMDGRIMAIWGVVVLNTTTRHALPWMLTTGVVDQYKKTFVRLSQAGVRMLRKFYRLSFNMVDARHFAAIRWARSLGFDVSEAVKFGREERDFVKITMIGEGHV